MHANEDTANPASAKCPMMGTEPGTLSEGQNRVRVTGEGSLAASLQLVVKERGGP